MRKSVLDSVIASFAACDPNVYLYWRYARLQAEDEDARPAEPGRSAEQTRKFEVVRKRKEATA